LNQTKLIKQSGKYNTNSIQRHGYCLHEHEPLTV